MLPTKESDEKVAADAHREDEKTANDARLAWFTELLFWATGGLCIVALFQLIMFGWQGYQLRKTVKATKEAASVATRGCPKKGGQR
jgi:predicted negative regulator of RcsB-dependent stress response